MGLAKGVVLMLCTGNSCRSQMAEGWLRHLSGGRVEVASAGLDPAAEVNPLAIRAMREIGIDIAGHRPKELKAFLGHVPVRTLVVVCDRAQNSCPRVWPGLAEKDRLYWPFDDPAHAVGTEQERMVVFRRVRDEIGSKLREWWATQSEGGGR